jgi:hypothetical protein
MATFPVIFAFSNWYTLKFIASRLGKSLRTVQYWNERGLFHKMGLKVITVHTKAAAAKGITWVQIPLGSRHAMFNRVHLDKPNINKLASNCEGSIQRS